MSILGSDSAITVSFTSFDNLGEIKYFGHDIVTVINELISKVGRG